MAKRTSTAARRSTRRVATSTRERAVRIPTDPDADSTAPRGRTTAAGRRGKAATAPIAGLPVVVKPRQPIPKVSPRKWYDIIVLLGGHYYGPFEVYAVDESEAKTRLLDANETIKAGATSATYTITEKDDPTLHAQAGLEPPTPRALTPEGTPAVRLKDADMPEVKAEDLPGAKARAKHDEAIGKARDKTNKEVAKLQTQQRKAEEKQAAAAAKEAGKAQAKADAQARRG